MALTLSGTSKVVINSYSAVFTGVQTTVGTDRVWTDISGLSITVTPASSSSKFLLIASVNGIAYDDGGFLRFSGGNSANVIGDTAGSRMRTFSSLKYRVNVIAMHTAIMSYLDSPATASAITYKVQFATDNDTTYINSSYGDTDGAYYPRGASTFQILEIAS